MPQGLQKLCGNGRWSQDSEAPRPAGHGHGCDAQAAMDAARRVPSDQPSQRGFVRISNQLSEE
jgi:hypothetical protein